MYHLNLPHGVFKDYTAQRLEPGYPLGHAILDREQPPDPPHVLPVD